MRGQMARSLSFCGVLMLVVLSGCDQDTIIKKMTPAEDESAARKYITLLQKGDLPQIEAALDPTLKRGNFHYTLSQMAALIPAEMPQSAKVVGVQVFHRPEVSTTNLAFEYHFPGK